tara:strand:+ start:437 stop:634 length:198 start_codon:yes stop_codon:yes gene_type:complete
MGYFFRCNECNYKETFNDQFNIPQKALEGKLNDYESVICSGCVSKKTRLKGNYIIIEKGTRNANV